MKKYKVTHKFTSETHEIYVIRDVRDVWELSKKNVVNGLAFTRISETLKEGFEIAVIAAGKKKGEYVYLSNYKTKDVLPELFETNKHTCRPIYDVEQLVRAMSRNQIVWCWGAQGWTVNDKRLVKFLRFKVNARYFRGWVYLTVNGLDLFNVYYTNYKNEIQHKDEDVYLEDLIMRIDGSIESGSFKDKKN